jgi:hypothetical protein
MSVYLALTTTTTKSLNMVTNAVSVADRALSSADNYMSYVEEHSKQFKARAQHSFALDTDELNLIAEQDAKDRITRRMLAHKARMSDPEYAAIYNEISFSKAPAALPAAE